MTLNDKKLFGMSGRTTSRRALPLTGFTQHHKNGAGFTLVEILVVIAIIGLLSAIVLASLNTTRAKGRDAARMVDVKSLKTAMEFYYDDHKSYPVVPNVPPPYVTAIANLGAGGTLLVPAYISAIPQMLVADSDLYVWEGTNKYGFLIHTELNGPCKTGVNFSAFWPSTEECDF